MMTKLKTKTNKKGFTVIELVMVVALIAILAAIAIPTVSNVINTANENVDKSNAQTVELAIKTAYAEAQAKGTLSIDGSSATPTNLTVVQALAYEGIGAIPTPKTNATFVYENGKVYCELVSGANHSGTSLTTSGLTAKTVVES